MAPAAGGGPGGGGGKGMPGAHPLWGDWFRIWLGGLEGPAVTTAPADAALREAGGLGGVWSCPDDGPGASLLIAGDGSALS